MLQQTIGQLNFKSPIVVAAGPLTDCIDKIKQAEDCGAGAVSTKLTMFSQQFPGVRKMYAKDGLYVFNPSDFRFHIDEGVRLVMQAKRDTNIPIFSNVSGGGSVEGWITVSKAMEEAGADALELNFACPNLSGGGGENIIPHGGQIARYPEIAYTVVHEVKKAVSIPVWVKFSGEGVAVPALVNAVERAGADGICPFYTLRGTPPIDIYNGGKPIIGGLDLCSFGGVNGRCIALPSNRIVAETAMNTKLPVMGGGGVSSMQDVVEKMMFGSSLVFVFSEILLKGFGVIEQLNRQLMHYVEQVGISNLSEVTGKALPYLVEPKDITSHHKRIVIVDQDRCVGCEKCRKIASCTAITTEGKKAVIHQERCVQCGLCASVCPSRAIQFHAETDVQ